MKYIKEYTRENSQSYYEMTFDRVGRKSSKKLAKKMRREMVAFLKKHKKADLNLEFGGYERLSTKFIKVFFRKRGIGKRFKRVIIWHMDLLDSFKMRAAKWA